jgi:hypothetical protein
MKEQEKKIVWIFFERKFWNRGYQPWGDGGFVVTLAPFILYY